MIIYLFVILIKIFGKNITLDMIIIYLFVILIKVFGKNITLDMLVSFRTNKTFIVL